MLVVFFMLYLLVEAFVFFSVEYMFPTFMNIIGNEMNESIHIQWYKKVTLVIICMLHW